MLHFAVSPIPCLSDNYAYVIVGPDHDAWVVDPSEAEPVLATLDRRALRLRGILATHHHPDHVDGIPALIARATRAGGEVPWVAAHVHDVDRISGLTVPISAPVDAYVETQLRIAGEAVFARWIPGHTLGAVAWRISDGVHEHVFTGDTLFAGGCGRLFEGSTSQMHTSLQALTELSPETRLWFGHEYTAQNLRFAQTIELENTAVADRLATLPTCTTPTTVAEEKATNPFVRARDATHLGELRRAKDDFRG
ncbi:MAG: hydroxyacylglutathione hydrolase [Nannocystaceae bacterium]